MTASPGRRLVVGNWKMNLGESEAVSLVRALTPSLPFDRTDAAVAPAFPCLRAVLDAVAGTALQVGAQNVHMEDRGAFTGEVAAPMLAGMGVRFVIVGHSERRTLFGDTDAIVARKVAAAARHGLCPILCVGETEAELDRGETHDVIARQLRAALEGIRMTDLVVAYEPVWAIGTGRTPRAEDVAAAHRVIRSELRSILPGQADVTRILYGGSATRDNVRELLSADNVGGALVGGASLDAASFTAIAEIAALC